MRIPILLLCTSLSAQTAEKTVGKVTALLPPAAVESNEATKGMPFRENESLKTGDRGRIRAQLNDGSILSLGSKSAIRIAKHDERSQKTIIELSYGMLRAQVVHLVQPDSSFEVRAHDCVIRFRGGLIVVDDSDPMEVRVTVFNEKVIVTRERQASVELTPGQWRIPSNGEPISLISLR